MEKGKVKWFNAVKGFGFITKENGEDVFVHFQDIKMNGFKKLEDGEHVEFDVDNSAKGLIARNVRKID